MNTHYLSLLGITLVMLVSCIKEEEPVPGEGNLSVEIGLFVKVNETDGYLKTTPSTDDFKVSIMRSSGSLYREYERAADMPEVIRLETGTYYIIAHSNNDLPAAFDNPYFYGRSEDFAILSNQQQTVVVGCELANTLVSIVYSDALKASFIDYETNVASQAGSLLFVRDETRTGYFRPLPLTITATLTYMNQDGSTATRTLTGSIPDPQAKRHYQIHVNASLNEGSMLFQISLDSLTSVEVVELNETTSGGSADIGYGDLIITEIMYDPTALSDTDGEWFEIYNTSSAACNLLNLVIRRNDTERHVIAESIEIQPGEYYVLARTQSAAGTGAYVYGSSISLTNTGSVLSLYNPGTVDGDGALIFSVNYGDAGFADCSGASLSLSPLLLNAQNAVMGSSWCKSSSVFGAGDLGTPGKVNDPCN